MTGHAVWAGADADFDRAVSFTPASYIWQRDKSHLVELPALWVRVPTQGRDADELGAEIDAVLAAEGCPEPHWLTAGEGHVFALWAIQPLRRPAKSRPEEHHAAFRAVLENWRKAAMKLSFALEPLGARPLDVALVDDLLLGYVPVPLAPDSPLQRALGLADEAPRLLREASHLAPVRVADVSKPLRRFDARLFAALGIAAPRRGRRSWLATPTSLAALAPKGPGGRHPAAVAIACAARWEGEDYGQILARLRGWAETCANDGKFPARRRQGDELELLAAWAEKKLRPGGPDKPTEGAAKNARQTTTEAITVALLAFLRGQGGAWQGAKGALAQQVALWRLEAGQPGLCPLTTLKRVLHALKASAQLFHDVEHDGQTWRSTWRLPAEPGGPAAKASSLPSGEPRVQKVESTWAPASAPVFVLSSSEGAAGERLLPAGGVKGGESPSGDLPAAIHPEQGEDDAADWADLPVFDATSDGPTPQEKTARQRRLPFPRQGRAGRSRRRKGTAGTGLPELTAELVDSLASVAPSLDRPALIALLTDARSRLRPRPRVLENFEAALGKRAARIHRRRLSAAMAAFGPSDRPSPVETRDVQEPTPGESGIDIAALFAAARLPFDKRSVVDRAQRLHLDGLSVIPLKPRSKEPATSWSEWQTRQMPLPELRAKLQALGEDAGLAVITGSVSGVVVADLDDASAVQWARDHLPPTPWVTRTSRGEHWYYRAPAEPLPPTTPPWSGQLQGEGRYVVVPGSKHPDGGVYSCAGDWTQPRENLPVFDARWLVEVDTLRRARLKILKP